VVATLHTPTPKAIKRGRERRSPSTPKNGAVMVYTIRNAVIRDPNWASESASSERFRLSTTAETT